MKLCQVLSVEKGVKDRVNKAITDLHRTANQEQLFNGFNRRYRPLEEEGQTFPDESKRVQQSVTDVVGKAASLWTELIDVTLTKDTANTKANSDLTLGDGTRIAEKLPVPFLLFLDKRLTDMRKFFSELPVLDASEDWEADANTGLLRTPEPSQTVKTKKVPKAFEASPATPNHPAQVQVFTEDQPIGTWFTRKFSGAINKTQRDEYVARIDDLLDAARKAREDANTQKAAPQAAGESIFKYILGGTLPSTNEAS